ncbi:MAG: hypothetical protein ABSH01_11105 [Terriglobia bacterium]|jgi:hypothetical protein
MKKLGRRDLLRNSLGATAALVGGVSYERKALMARMMAPAQGARVKEPAKGLQRGNFGKYEVSRLIIGGDPVSGIAHAGELVYQADFMTQYFTTPKILETLTLAEQNGINTLLMRADDRIISHYNMFKRERGGTLQWIATTAPEQGSPVENAKRARDNGAIAVYLHGGVADGLVKAGKVDEIGEIVEGFKKSGIMAGMGAHLLDTARASVQAKIDPDFYMMTINRVNYYCSEAAEVGVFMRSIKKPWIAFKVLGAGRVKPQEGFRLAFEHGSDFLAVGMFDWQIRDDVAHVQEMLANGISRERDWA